MTTTNQRIGILLVTVLVTLAASCGPSHRLQNGDAGGDDTIDASPFGAQCAASSECPNGGLCVAGYGGHVCTYTCDAGCPADWSCRATTVDGALVSACVPPDFELCTPCQGDQQCGGGICIPLGGSDFCLPKCPFEGACPTGYTCGADPTGGHNGEQYCVPDTHACSCTTAADDGQVRTCSKMNSVGTCPGIETCHPTQGGWIGCSAPSASAETCDGLDNDCNQLIDDGLGGSTCPITVAGVGTCQGHLLCAGAAGSLCQGQTPTAETCNYIDDNCNGMVDETYPLVGTLCMAGIGGCQRFGVERCNVLGNGLDCSASAGASTSELCNGVDDDCDGTVDNGFPTKGATCTAGVGVCARTGNNVCSVNGLGVTCSVMPGSAGTESCNGLDDDCDGVIDNGFRDVSTGTYHQDTACGSCAVNCQTLFALPNGSGHCFGTTTPTCGLMCNTNAFDLDLLASNGCELVLDTGAIYVSTDDAHAADNAGCGLGPWGTNGAVNYPCKTIAQGIAQANSLSRARVLVANGIYAEAVTLANGRSLLGGYRADNWQRDVASTGTMITGVTSVGNHDRTVIANNITVPTVFEGFVVFGSVNNKPNGNSYALYVATPTANLQIKNNVVFGGRGGPGTSGGNGGDGGNGSDGLGRNTTLTTNDAAYDAHEATNTGTCSSANNRQYTNGGSATCGGDDVSGGQGGGNTCPFSAGTSCTCSNTACACTFDLTSGTAATGIIGQPGNGPGGGAGGGGLRGYDFIAGPNLSGPNAGFYCYLPHDAATQPNYKPTAGTDGVAGTRGGNGNAVLGCTATGGSVSGGEWVGGVAPAGVNGGNGGGGGGGGGGAGGKCQNCSTNRDKIGAHGGGGGAGGCGGVAGTGATAGGGAFGIFIVGGAAPVVTGNSVFRGSGGTGGVGGAGGRAGTGGSGALGGTSGVPVTFCADLAGRGGNGGDGGYASGGGGGCGGSSYGIYTSGIGAPTYCQVASANTISTGGAGAGGAGGYSTINPGGAGTAGILLDCSFN